MSNPEEYVTFETDSGFGVRHGSIDGAEEFAEDINHVEVFIQVVESDDLDDNGFNTYRRD
jgi:hypothetical protein